MRALSRPWRVRCVGYGVAAAQRCATALVPERNRAVLLVRKAGVRWQELCKLVQLVPAVCNLAHAAASKTSYTLLPRLLLFLSRLS